MATPITDMKRESAVSDDNQRIEALKDGEKASQSSAELEGQYVDDEAEANRVLRKVDFRLVPMLSLLYLVAFIDRSNSTKPYCFLSAVSLLIRIQLAMPKSQA